MIVAPIAGYMTSSGRNHVQLGPTNCLNAYERQNLHVFKRHVMLTVAGIDRVYLNVYVPGLQYSGA